MAVLEPDRMAGVVAALIAHHPVEGRAEEIDDLPLALIPPLHPDDDDIGHGAVLRLPKPGDSSRGCADGQPTPRSASILLICHAT